MTYHADDRVTLYLGDCREVMASLDPCSVDAIVTDPPYELVSAGRQDARGLRYGEGGKETIRRNAGGFMNMKWDATGVTYDVQTWAAAYRVLKPGGHLVAFGAPRTYHRLACAIEDAGFEVRDSLMWLYGSGFPKSLDVSKAIDKAAGAERDRYSRPAFGGTFSDDNGSTYGTAISDTPATPDAERWQGWGTALKPSHEIIVHAVKPVNSSTIDENLSRLEAALWSMLLASGVALPSESNPSAYDAGLFDGARWSADGSVSMSGASFAATDTSPSVLAMGTSWNTVRSWRRILGAISEAMSTYTTETTSSLITDLKTSSYWLSEITPEHIIQAALSPHGLTPPVSHAVEAFDGAAKRLSAIRMLFAPAPAIALGRTALQAEGAFRPDIAPIVLARKPLVGTVAQNVLAHGTGGLNVDGCRIEASDKATFPVGVISTTERAGRWPANVILDEAAAALLDAEAGEWKTNVPGKRGSDSRSLSFGMGVQPPFDYGNSGGPSRFFYTAKASRSEREAGLEDFEALRRSDGREKDIDNPRLRTSNRRNDHPTVKPGSLMRWLCRLITPPGGVVLDPFMGSGSTRIAALAEGMRFVGIDLEPRYVDIAGARAAQAGFTLEP